MSDHEDWPEDLEIRSIIADIFPPTLRKKGGAQLKECVRRLWETAYSMGYAEGESRVGSNAEYYRGFSDGVQHRGTPESAKSLPPPLSRRQSTSATTQTDIKPANRARTEIAAPSSPATNSTNIHTRMYPDPSAAAGAKATMGDGKNGVWTGSTFEAPVNTTPEFMFPARRTNVCSYPRFCIRPEFASALSPPRTMMLYTDGACPSNGLAKARGGFAFVFNETPGGQCSSALEHKGPDGQVHTPTSNRAELRAVIAALNFRSWGGEGWRRVVIVTDSEYVAKGATIRVRNWAARSWRTADGKPVANRDLWEALSEAMGSCAADGCEVSFWMVPREWNSLADTAAKAGSQLESRLEYGDICGVLC